MNILSRKRLFILFKCVLFILVCWFIANQLFLKNDIRQQWQVFQSNLNGDNIPLLLMAVVLMPVNWLLEVIKWKWLINSRAPFFHLLKSIIAGITIGFITPGRSGEFIGRLLILDEENKPKVFYLTVMGGIAHTVVTLGAGAFFVGLWSPDLFWSGLATGGAVVFALFYFRYDLFNRILSGIPFLQRRQLILAHTDLPDVFTQISVLFITLLRYFVYVCQYCLLQEYLGVYDAFAVLLIYNGVFFLIQAFSPLMPYLDISVRGGVALYVFGNLTDNNIAVLTAITAAWLLNLVIPALIGYLFILNRRATSYVV